MEKAGKESLTWAGSALGNRTVKVPPGEQHLTNSTRRVTLTI